MREPSFCLLLLEELEKRHMLNMILGQLGTPASGIVSSKCDTWEGSAVTTTSRAAQVWSAGKGDLSLFSPPADSSSDVAVLLAGGGGQSATIATTSCTVHQNKTDTNATDSGSNAFWNNPLELVFQIANNPSLALRGGEDISMTVSASAKLAAASGSSSTGGSVSGTEGSVSRGPVAGGIASLASASPSQSAPMMLFPSAQGPGSVHTGSQKGLKGSLQIIPTFANGPNVFTGMVNLSLPAYVPVNADDDNGSGVTFGIPAKRDFDVSPLQVNDPELLPGTLEGVGLPAGGTWVVTSYSTGGTGQIRLWIDQKKTAPFSPSGLGAFGFDVEGAHESSAIGDVTVSATYLAPSGVSWNDTVSITVTPVINSFGVTVAGGDNGQNVNYTMGNDGSNGLWAKTPNGNASASFKGLLDVHAINGQAQFIQNILNVSNGNNGTKDKNGTPVGWLYQDNTGQVDKPTQPGSSFPLLDVPKGSTSPPYIFASSYTVQNGIGTLTDSDFPSTGHPPNGNTGIAVDYLETFQLHLVWQYNNNGPDRMTAIYYPLAYTHWQVNFWAIGNLNAPPIDNIKALHGVTSDGSNNNTRSNDPPGQMNPSPATIGNGNPKWVAA